MKSLTLLALFALSGAAQITGTHRVYILPMPGGFDNFLAERLAHDPAIQVVTDPKTADSILTDRIGEAFEQRMAKIYPQPNADTSHRPGFRSNFISGTMFLVDSKTRQVLWSDFRKPPKYNTAKSLDRQAGLIAKKLHDPAPKTSAH